MGLNPGGFRGSLRNVSVKDKTIESFEDGDISEWGGVTDAYIVQQGPVSDGDHAVESDGKSRIMSNTSPTLTTGIEYRADIRADNSSDTPQWGFFTQEETNQPKGYFEELRISKNEVRIFRFEGGGDGIGLSSVINVSLSTSTFYSLVFKAASDGTLTFGVQSDDNNNRETATTTDSTYTSGGIGVHSSGGDEFWDYVREA